MWIESSLVVKRTCGSSKEVTTKVHRKMKSVHVSQAMCAMNCTKLEDLGNVVKLYLDFNGQNRIGP